MIGWTTLVEEATKLGREAAPLGRVAEYIPELAGADPLSVGIAVVTPDGARFQGGDVTARFTLQSVSKVLSLMLVLMEAGEEALFRRVGMEPTGDPYNSIIRLETGPEKPLNPFINAGAIAVADLIPGHTLTERLSRLLRFVQDLAESDTICVNEKVAQSEWATGHRNRALAYFLKDRGHLDGSVEESLQLYFAQCAIEVTCADLARIAGRLAFPDGRLPARAIHTALALMTTCGLYDGSGEFAVRAGIPAKSGVAGGIMAVAPGRAGIAAFGPALDGRGNSIAGIAMLGHLSARAGLSIFLPQTS